MARNSARKAGPHKVEIAEPGSLVVEQWNIKRLQPYDRNPRKNDLVVDRMCDAIREFGFRIPIVARSDGLIVDGHLRYKAAVQMGIKKVPVALADNLTETQVRAFRILANKSASWAEWDQELLVLELGELKRLDFDLNLTGFSANDLVSFIASQEAGGTGQSNGSLAERFGIPPFSVLNAREGWWQDRKRAWLSLGIQSELGRGENLLKMSDTMLEPDPVKRAARKAAA